MDQSGNKRIAKNTFYLYFRMVLLLVVGLYSSRVTLKALGISDYGIFNVVGGIVTMFTFINYAMVNSTQRYITYELGKRDFRKLSLIFSTSINIHVLISLIIILLSETIGLWFLYNKMVIPEERMTAALWIFQFSIISCIVTVISAPYNALIIAYEKMSAFAIISLLDAFFKLGVVFFLLYYSGDRLILYGALILLIFIVDFFAYKLYCNKYFSESKYIVVVNKPLMKEMSGFASWNLLGNLSYVCFTQGLNILLNVFFNPVVNAARGIAVQVQTIVANFSYNIENAIKPQITKSYAQKDMQRMCQLMSLSARLSFYILLLLSIPLLLETHQLLDLWLVVVPDHTVNFLRLTILILMVDSLTGPLLIAAQSTGKMAKYQLTVSLISMSILPLSYFTLQFILIPEIVFVVNLIVIMVVQIVRLTVVSQMIKLSSWWYAKEVFLKALLVALISTIIPILYWYGTDESFIRLLIVTVISTLIVFPVIYFLGITKDERYFVKSKLQQQLQKISKHG